MRNSFGRFMRNTIIGALFVLVPSVMAVAQTPCAAQYQTAITGINSAGLPARIHDPASLSLERGWRDYLTAEPDGTHFSRDLGRLSTSLQAYADKAVPAALIASVRDTIDTLARCATTAGKPARSLGKHGCYTPRRCSR